MANAVVNAAFSSARDGCVDACYEYCGGTGQRNSHQWAHLHDTDTDTHRAYAPP